MPNICLALPVELVDIICDMRLITIAKASLPIVFINLVDRDYASAKYRKYYLLPVRRGRY